MELTQRKRPVQRRSSATVDYILATAARILEDEGLPGPNTNLIAARAGISIGSLYQYFPNKQAITAALIVRAHEQIVAALAEVIERTRGMSIGFAIGVLVDLMIQLQARQGRLSRILETEEERLPRTSELQELEGRIEALNLELLGRYVDPARCSAEQLDNAARDTVSIVRAMLDAAGQHGTLGAPDLPARLYRVVEGYLAPLLARPEAIAAA